MFMLEEPDRDLEVSVTALSGDPDFVISTVYQRPFCDYSPYVQCHNYTWRAATQVCL